MILDPNRLNLESLLLATRIYNYTSSSYLLRSVFCTVTAFVSAHSASTDFSSTRCYGSNIISLYKIISVHHT